MHFSRAFKEAHTSNKTTKAGGYAANVIREQANMLAEMSQDTASALANLATATQSDRTAVAQLTETVATLSVHLKQTQAKLDAANIEITRLRHTPCLPGAPGPATDAGTKRAARLAKQAAKVWATGGYCHSHGYKVEEDHTSCTCRKRAAGHNPAATRADTMGGSQWNKGWDE